MKYLKKEFSILMKRKFTAVIAFVLVCCLMMAMFASCNKPEDNESSDVSTPSEHEHVTFDPNKDYVYKDAVSTLAANWNPHTWQVESDQYPLLYTQVGLYDFVFNDELHPSEVEGIEPYAGYVIIPEMAAELPVDVTEDVKKIDNNKYGIPESATKGYAYKIKLNPNAKWSNGEAINADTWIYSAQKLFDPKLLNYRATDAYAGAFSIANAEKYARAGQPGVKNYSAIGMTVEEYVAQGGKVEDLLVDMSGFWNVSSADGLSYASVTDDRMVRDEAIPEGEDEDYVSAKYLYDNYLAPGAPYAPYAGMYLGTGELFTYDKDYSFDNVGIYKTGDYEITVVLSKSLTDFYLLYYIGGWAPLVYEPLYESCLSQDENGVWSSNYCTSLETSISYGPYKMDSYQSGSSMSFVKNEYWYGYTDGKHTYVDPTDNKIYDMYQTTKITTLVVGEAATRKEMFLKGQVMSYGLQAEDFEQYRSSESCFFTPDETIYFFIFNGHVDAIKNREANDGFDQTKYDLETLTLESFRRAVAVTYDKEALCTAISPARSGGYGIIGNNYIYDPVSGAKYRDTDQAKKALCNFYSVDVSKYADLDAAVDSITGYDPVAAKELYQTAFEEALEKGFITSKDGKTCDQTIEIEYAASDIDSFQEKIVDYLTKMMGEVTVGTPFEGKIVFKLSAPLGNGWSDNIKNGLSDTVLGGWGGSALDPYALTDLYVNPAYTFDAGWFDANKINMTVNIDGSDLTMTLYQWSDALNGLTVTVGGKDYNFGYGQADNEVRLTILAAFENTILQTYDYIPMIQNAGASLLSHQVYNVIDEYNAILGRGGIAYMKYNYDEQAWKDFVAQQGGTLSY